MWLLSPGSTTWMCPAAHPLLYRLASVIMICRVKSTYRRPFIILRFTGNNSKHLLGAIRESQLRKEERSCPVSLPFISLMCSERVSMRWNMHFVCATSRKSSALPPSSVGLERFSCAAPTSACLFSMSGGTFSGWGWGYFLLTRCPLATRHLQCGLWDFTNWTFRLFKLVVCDR